MGIGKHKRPEMEMQKRGDIVKKQTTCKTERPQYRGTTDTRK